MGFFQNLKNFFNLSEADRQTIWRSFGSFQSNSLVLNGNSMIENSYEKNVDVYAVIKKIVDITKSIDWVVERRLSNGNWKPVENTTIHELMAYPNETKGYTWNDIEEQALLYLLTTGNAYIFGEKPMFDNKIWELDILPSNYIDIKANNDFFMPVYEYQFKLGTNQRKFSKEDLAHVKFFNPAYCDVQDSLYGLSIIQVAAQVIQVGNDRWDADANLLQNRGAIGLISDRSQRPMTGDEAKIVQNDFQARTGGTKNFGKVVVTNKDLNYIQMAMSSADLQLIEKNIVNLRTICNVFGLDSSLFNDPANKTFNNRLEAEKSLFTNVIMPLSDKLSENLTRFICNNHYPDKTYRLRQDFSKVECLQENYKDKADTLTKLVNAGILAPNEAREKLGEVKLQGEQYDLPKANNTQLNNNPIDTQVN